VYLLRSTVQGLEFALAVSDLEPARSRLAG
jgi:hypothetical protein